MPGSAGAPRLRGPALDRYRDPGVSGTSRTDARSLSRARLARTLGALGAFGEGRRHGAEALRLAMREGREEQTDRGPRLPRLLVPRPRGPGARDPGVRPMPGSQSCLGNRSWLSNSAASLGYACALQGRLTEGRALLEEGIRESIRTGARQIALWVAWLSEVCRLMGHGDEAWQHARQALALARQHKERGTRRSRCTSLAPSRPTPTPPMPRRPKPTTGRPSPWPRNSACARSRPTATTALARCTPRSAAGAGPTALSTAIDLYRAMDMTFWLPQAEAALAQVEGR